MSCFFPLKGYYARERNPSGKRSIVFDPRRAETGVALQIPCGQCSGCRLAKARTWAIRCMHELRMHRASAFVTLTYADQHVPQDGSLRKADLQLFMKRFRHARPLGVRFFACGEYGDLTHRPHYHILFLNSDFPDMRQARLSKKGFMTYRSEELSRLWPVGENIIGQVTAQSCAYVARYTLKKVTGPAADDHYGGREPEFLVMSRRPGIGYSWLREYHPEAYRHDSVILESNEVGVPRFYDTKMECLDPAWSAQVDGRMFSRVEQLKVARRREALKFRADNSYARRVVKDRFETARAAFFVRDA